MNHQGAKVTKEDFGCKNIEALGVLGALVVKSES